MGHISTRDRANGVAVLTADRPPANAMNLALLDEIVAAVQRFTGDPPSALVHAGRRGFFSAGVDLKLAPTYGPEDRRRMVSAINAMALGVYELPCPVVGAITGQAVAVAGEALRTVLPVGERTVVRRSGDAAAVHCISPVDWAETLGSAGLS